MRTSPLSTGIYSIPQAARLIRVHPARLRAWVCGHSGAKSGPLIKTELPVVDHNIALSFVNVIEARFIAEFAKHGVHVRSIRYMAEQAEDYLSTPHPFATDNIFRTDGRKIFIEAANRTGDPKLYDLKSRNWAMHKILKDALLEGVEFSAGFAEAWFPRRQIAPSVRVSPKVSFGSPALLDSGVPTEALYDALLAEGRDYKSVARWFDLPVQQIEEAVKFEIDLKNLN